MPPKKRGPKPDPDLILMRATLVRDDPAQMKLLEDAGYTHAEAYRIGSRLLTRTQTPASMEAEKLKEEAESARIEAEAAALRYQRLLSMLQESREEEERAAQAKRDQDSAVIHAAEILYEARDNIRRGSQGNVYRIRAALDLLPPGTVNSDDIRILFRSGKEAPSMENILDFLQSHI